MVFKFYADLANLNNQQIYFWVATAPITVVPAQPAGSCNPLALSFRLSRWYRFAFNLLDSFVTSCTASLPPILAVADKNTVTLNFPLFFIMVNLYNPLAYNFFTFFRKHDHEAFVMSSHQTYELDRFLRWRMHSLRSSKFCLCKRLLIPYHSWSSKASYQSDGLE